ncbi:MAG: DEAD/DEAH box helicase [Clostridia bacterium]|nr:DEAD/DEAH box helicase [Clostridia bacterium]
MELFSSFTREWFLSSVGAPTPVQSLSWNAIRSGTDCLISAPTGSGKTLAAFLYFLDKLYTESMKGELSDEVRIIYISPLKALGNDIRENLKRPISGLGLTEKVRIAIRNGDTDASERQKIIRHPPHILITTPESLYLMLSSASGRRTLSRARTVIIDEFHAVISSKRGTHLMLSLARLDALHEKPLQRIALSATIQPLEEAKKQLSGNRACAVICPETTKKTELMVDSAVKDMRFLPKNSIWPALADRMIDHMNENRTVLAFTEGRASCERLAQKINETAESEIALTHHGCVSKEQRLEAEKMLKSGELKAMIATSSMELGIDVGEIDQVIQVGSPISVSSLMQRMGRAGHSPGRVSRMIIYPKTASDAVACALMAKAAKEGNIERIQPMEMCLDILAQHLVSMAAADGTYSVSEAVHILSNAYSYRFLTEEIVRSVLIMLSGDYEHDEDRPVRPRLIYDRIHDLVSGDKYTDMLALSSGGTIPDRGWYKVTLADGTHLGELDEEYVFEARLGDKFLLGAFPWKIVNITRDRVIAESTSPSGAASPFWKGDGQMRSYETGLIFGKCLRALSDAAIRGNSPLIRLLTDMYLTENAAKNAARILTEQINCTGTLASDQCLIFEHFRDEAGEHQLMVHSPFGGKVNRALGMLLMREAEKSTSLDARVYDDDDGILIYIVGGKEIPDGLIYHIDPETAASSVVNMLPATPMFSMLFRYNAQRAMLMGAKSGRRLPLWVQRLRGAQTLSGAVKHPEHPMMIETINEIKKYQLDLDALRDVLQNIRSGQIHIREIHTDTPSPMCLNLRRQVEAEMMYETAIPSAAKAIAGQNELTIQPDSEAIRIASTPAKSAKNAEEVHTLFMQRGDMLSEEIPAPVDFPEALVLAGRACYIEPGLWIAREHENEYKRALESDDDESFLTIVRRLTRYQGQVCAEMIAERYAVSMDRATRMLSLLSESGMLKEYEGMYVHKDVFESAKRKTLEMRRREVETAAPERYADALTSLLRPSAPPGEQLLSALKSLSYEKYPAEFFEEVLLPARVSAYRESRLDDLLLRGEAIYRVHPGEKPMISFIANENADSDIGTNIPSGLSGGEEKVYAYLLKRGASFFRQIRSGTSLSDPAPEIQSLFQKGLIRSDSFVPVRKFLKETKAAGKSAVLQRVKALDAGRWEIPEAEKPLSPDQALEHIFSSRLIACRETAGAYAWSEILEVLRRMEYQGKVRRGYFVKGISGAQFVKESDYPRIRMLLSSISGAYVCINASDPMQPWGAILPHTEADVFTRLASSAVVLHSGRPEIIFEKNGETLRSFRPESPEEAAACFANAYRTRSIFPNMRRIVLKKYPVGFEAALESAGFQREALEYVLYRD